MSSLSESRAELDAITADIELTLVSIIQGVALTVLIETSREAIAKLDWMMWPYVLSGLIIILVFWSRVVLHILTVIRWPLEFGHNFLYIACALVEAFSFGQIGNPGRWFAFVGAFLAVGWLLFAYDLRLIRMRVRDRTGDVSNRLYALVTRDQRLNVGLLLPAFFLVNVACAVAIHLSARVFSRARWTYLANRAATDRFRGISVIRRDVLYETRAPDRASARGMADKKPCHRDVRLADEHCLGAPSEPHRLHQRLQLGPLVKAAQACCPDKGLRKRCPPMAGESFRRRPKRQRRY